MRIWFAHWGNFPLDRLSYTTDVGPLWHLLVSAVIFGNEGVIIDSE